jgi:hypothetical protein
MKIKLLHLNKILLAVQMANTKNGLVVLADKVAAEA